MGTWSDFCRELERAGDFLDRAETPRDEVDQAEGLRYLTRLLRVGLDLTLEFADPRHPELVPQQAKHFGDGGNTADCAYHHAVIDGRLHYRLHGARGGAPLVEIGVYAGKIGLHDTSRRVDSLTEHELVVDERGFVDVHLAPAALEGAANQLHTDDSANYLFVRQYAHDWRTTEPADLQLEVVDAAPRNEALTLADTREGLLRAARFVSDATVAWAAVVDGARRGPANTLTPVPDDLDMTLPSGHRYAFGHFDLAEDQALVITFEPDDVPYWGIALNNYWFEVPDYGGEGSHCNNRSAQYEPDGKVSLVIARRPVDGNWLDTRGHRVGVMVFRWFRTARPVPTFTCRVVPRAGVAARTSDRAEPTG